MTSSASLLPLLWTGGRDQGTRHCRRGTRQNYVLRSQVGPHCPCGSRPLRNRLKTYYDSEGAQDAILITLPKGGYVPEFAKTTQAAWRSAVRNPIILISAGIVGGLALAAVAFLFFHKAPEAGEVLRLSLIAPPGSTIQNSRISPDGKMVAFTALQQNRRTLWVRSLDSSVAGQPLARLLRSPTSSGVWNCPVDHRRKSALPPFLWAAEAGAETGNRFHLTAGRRTFSCSSGRRNPTTGNSARSEPWRDHP